MTHLVIAFLFTASANIAYAQTWLNVQSYGADGGANDDVGDANYDSSEIEAAVAALPSRGGVIYFPPGKYRLSRPLVLPDKRVTLLGDGIGISTLEWQTSSGGIVYSPTILSSPAGNDDGRELSVSKLTLRTTASGGGTAIYAAWPEIAGQYGITANIKEVEIRGSSFNQYWNNGLTMIGARQSNFENLTIVGAATTGYALMDAALKLVSNGYSSDYKIRNVFLLAANYGIAVVGGVSGTGSGPEGIYIDNATIINVGTGVVVNTPDSEPLTFVRGSHIDAHSLGIDSSALNSTYADNLIFISDPGGVGIRIKGLPINVIVRSNTVSGTNSGAGSLGVVFQSGTQRSSIVNNHFESGGTCIWLQSGSQFNYVAENVFSNCSLNKVLNSGTSNTVFGWGGGAP